MIMDVNGVQIGVENLPNRVKPVLTIIDGNEHEVVAHFNGLLSAENFVKRLAKMFEEAGVRVIKESVKEVADRDRD